MGMRPSDKDLQREDRAAKRAHDAAHRNECIRVIEEWNRLMQRRYKPRWSPVISVALSAGFFYLDALCPGCRQYKYVDLRKLDRHRDATLHSIIPKLSCRDCQPSPPFAQLVGLSQYKDQSGFAPLTMPKRER